MILALLACAGSALVLTQSSLTAPVRDAIDRHIASYERSVFAPGFKRRGEAYLFLMRAAAKLTSCPMCAGFWLGLAWAAALGSRGVELVALGLAGSLASALLVALWMALSEAHAALALWRYLKTPDRCEKCGHASHRPGECRHGWSQVDAALMKPCVDPGWREDAPGSGCESGTASGFIGSSRLRAPR